MGNEVLDRPGIILGDYNPGIGNKNDLEMFGADKFPDEVWLIEYSNGTWAAFAHYFAGEHTHGLAACSSEGRAIHFNEMVQSCPPGSTYHKMDLDKALDTAAARKEPIKGLMLVDNWEDPKMRFVR